MGKVGSRSNNWHFICRLRDYSTIAMTMNYDMFCRSGIGRCGNGNGTRKGFGWWKMPHSNQDIRYLNFPLGASLLKPVRDWKYEKNRSKEVTTGIGNVPTKYHKQRCRISKCQTKRADFVDQKKDVQTSASIASATQVQCKCLIVVTTTDHFFPTAVK